MTLKELQIGQSALIQVIGGQGALRQHFLDMGLIPGAEIKVLKYAPLGDPMEVKIHGYSLSLRLAEAAEIEIVPLDKAQQPDEELGSLIDNVPYNAALHEHNAHPGLGEEGKYHSATDENPLPKGSKLTFALAGQQNSGKTTLFNQLTGANQHVGNFPGITVDRKDGAIKGHADTLVTDLPGIYSLSPYSAEEIVTRNMILNEKPKAIINIVDATNIERNLYLTVQLMELGVPMVLALNMMDEVKNNGGAIRINEMEKLLGIPVVPISAAKNEGVDELVEHAIHVAKYQETPIRQDFCVKNEEGGAVHRCLHSIMHLIEDHAEKAGLPSRFAADKLVEGDESVMSALQLTQNEQETIEHIIKQMEEERGLDRNAAMADMRFAFIKHLCARTVVKPRENKDRVRSGKIDRLLTGKYTALPMFILILALVFWLTFDVIGAWLQDLLDAGITALGDMVNTAFVEWQVSEPIRSLVVDAIFGGVGSVLSFVPIIIVLFFFLSLMEDSGYMARIAFISDGLLRKLGLSGRSIVPMLISFGCTVPGVMATRTLPSTYDRKRTIILTPFMSCSAKIAIYGFLTNAFFPNHTGLIMVGLYLLGILVGIVVALISKAFRKSKETTPFVMELPPYRMPGAKNVGHLLWDKTKDFVQRAFTVIFLATLVVWFLQSFDFRFNMVEDSADSMLATIAGGIAFIFQPLGMDDWRIVTSLISGFLAKESVVSTMEVLNMTESLTTLTAIPLLIFSLLYTPCVAAIASVRRELGSKWALWMIFFQCAVAWVAAWIGYLIAGLFI
ncbi:MAG: ferrous iron transport protein B [Bacteroidales bacterium]|nr:ferrous iron transport protein B [Bacteroidales bacterium]